MKFTDAWDQPISLGDTAMWVWTANSMGIRHSQVTVIGFADVRVKIAPGKWGNPHSFVEPSSLFLKPPQC